MLDLLFFGTIAVMYFSGRKHGYKEGLFDQCEVYREYGYHLSKDWPAMDLPIDQ